MILVCVEHMHIIITTSSPFSYLLHPHLVSFIMLPSVLTMANHMLFNNAKEKEFPNDSKEI